MKWITKSFQELTITELYAILALRAEVFVVEQNCPYQDVDGKDPLGYHVFSYDNDRLIAYARVLKPGVAYPEIAIGRVVVHPENRGKKIGAQLMEACHDFIEEQLGVQPIRLSAQSHLTNFYAQLGYASTGKTYLEDDIPHTEMLKP